ncbi:MAG: hypothetical protein FJ026_15140 [Chloroflexi bacterium]|nr:hypothetical protein [Chloroflexota bacterium]
MKRSAITLGVLFLLCALLFGACDRPAAVRPTAEPGAVLLAFERTGGIAGFMDRLVVGYGGEYYLTSGGQVERIGLLSAERRGQLQTWLASFAPFTLRLEDNPGGPDNMVRGLVWAGLGRTNAGEAEQQEMLKWAGDLLAELSETGR